MTQKRSSPFVYSCILFFFFSISDAHLIHHEALNVNRDLPGRSLTAPLASTKDCSVDFSKVDFNSLLKKCRGPPYPDKPCCDGLREVSCPYCDQLNDVKNNNCAYNMFFEINKKGNYPVGLFFNMCAPWGDKDRNLPCDN